MITLPQKALTLVWSSALDLDDFRKTPLPTQAEYPGVYLHVTTHTTGGISTYVGKSESSVNFRQQQHIDEYNKGKYWLFDSNGQVTHIPYSTMEQNYQNILDSHIKSTKIYHAQIKDENASLKRYLILGTESLLIQSRKRTDASLNDINGDRGTKIYKIFERLDLIHTGDPLPVAIFGGQTTWEKEASQIT